MQKYTLFILLSIFASIQSYGQAHGTNGYKVIVDAGALNPSARKIYLNILKMTDSGLVVVIDSAVLKSGKATFKGTVSEPVLCRLQTGRFGAIGSFCLSNNMIFIGTGSNITRLRVRGAPYQKDFEMLNRREASYHPFIGKLNEDYLTAMHAKDGVKAAKINQEIIAANTKMLDDVYGSYIKHHTSALSIYAFRRLMSDDQAKMKMYYKMLPAALKKLPTALYVKAQIDTKDALAIGQIAPEIIEPDTSGNIVSLSSFKGKYVLVDFWASWCHPCRAESPYMIKAYNDFQSKNFIILSVSMDDTRTRGAWRNAIQTDKVGGWPQLADLKAFNSPVAIRYNIHSIPQNYLIDPDGKIIATDLRGEELENRLAKILK